MIDTVGGTVQQRSLDVLKRDGVLVALSAEVPDEVKAEAERRGIRTRYFSVEPNADTLTKISRLVANGRVRTTVSSVYPSPRLELPTKRAGQDTSEGPCVCQGDGIRTPRVRSMVRVDEGSVGPHHFCTGLTHPFGHPNRTG
ncbi:zinc-binding dehydrogenase [Rhodococcus sp. WB9]|uniref:zinc-binding dehydrogenase n=1 Tax=Rhodococcus sp. WB9 TaxID=2594007 RepID=UPI0021B3D642|nr:zinc-binding dehydrogenase [Rhodococcus sp. WB9]